VSSDNKGTGEGFGMWGSQRDQVVGPLLQGSLVEALQTLHNQNRPESGMNLMKMKKKYNHTSDFNC
jgi:hypothetical protein